AGARSAVSRGLGLWPHAPGRRRAMAARRRCLRSLVGCAGGRARRGCAGAWLHACRARWWARTLVPAPGDAVAALRDPRPAAAGVAPVVRHGLERARRALVGPLPEMGATPLLAHPARPAALAGEVLPGAHLRG